MSVQNPTVHLQFARLAASLLDNRFGIGKFRFGISALIDLIPGIGDIADVILSCYLVWIGIMMRIPSQALAEMMGNIVLSFLIGLIPIIGDAGYLFYKPNLRNLKILELYSSRKIQEGEILR